MYEAFFGLQDRPFSAVPLAKRFFAAPAIEAARQGLVRCIERSEGAGLIIGPIGIGKSILCQVLAAQFRGRSSVALLTGGALTNRRALLQAVLYELGLPYRDMGEGELRLSLIDYLSPRDASTQITLNRLLLIVDEAHTLPFRILEELRLITNLVLEGRPLVTLILSGAPSLEERFAGPKLASFNQRIAARCYLDALDRKQTNEYVRFQIAQVKGNPDSIFSASALDAVFNATDGIPRLINQVCDHALLLAYAGGARNISDSSIEEAWSDLQQLPTPMSGARPQANAQKRSVVEFGHLDEDVSDEMPAALPFRSPNLSSAHLELDPIQQIEAVEKELFELGDDFQPAGSIRPEVELVFQSTSNPFDESFDEEEVVIDRYTAIETDALANRPRVTSSESLALSALLTPFEREPQPSVAVAAASWPGGTPDEHRNVESRAKTPLVKPSQTAAVDAPLKASGGPPAQRPWTETVPRDELVDEDLIVVEEPPEQIISVSKKLAPRVKRQEYRQLFAKLRRG